MRIIVYNFKMFNKINYLSTKDMLYKGNELLNMVVNI